MIGAGLIGSEGSVAVLLGVEVRAEVVAGHACAVVRQRYRNDGPKPIEAVYTFPLPSKSVLTGFSMTVAGRRLDGEVHEREEAFRKYDDAITTGHGAALLEQERPNIFTANVGNLLPGEETIIEVQYVEPVLADEGAIRWSIPTVVAPRYIPGNPSGDRTAHGTADPTDKVPDADRISPPIGAVSYGLAVDLTFDLGVAVDVESPSHAVVVTHEGAKARVTFSQKEVPLDRDVVVTAYARSSSSAGGDATLASGVCHRVAGKPGAFALTVVPDFSGTRAKASSQAVVFVLDRSGSMGGASMPEARTALRLCLRQLREGDRFAILAFDDSVESFEPALVPFTQATLQRADQWLATIEARGGTELLAPMLAAAELLAPPAGASGTRAGTSTRPNGIVVVLTDGEVGNEDEILTSFMPVAARGGTRVFSFGIGTNVSDALLIALAEKTGGAVEMIHPGERLDEKVVAQFARATAARVTDVVIKTRGIELAELAPAEPRPLVDGEPYCVFATYEEAGRGAVEIRGKLDGEPFYVEVPVDLAAESDRPVIAKLWAQARIRDLERASLDGRRQDAMKARIVKLAVENGVSSKYTSFIVVEKRTGDRRATGQPETHVVAVNAPAGWDMFKAPPGAQMKRMKHASAPMMSAGRARPMAMPMSMSTSTGGFGGGLPGAGGGALPPPRAAAPAAPPALGRLYEAEADSEDTGAIRTMVNHLAAPAPAPAIAADPILDVLSLQGASGLWEESGRDAVSATVDALLVLLRLGLSTAHPVYGAQLKKALDALLAHLRVATVEPRKLELALGVAWLLASGRRTRHAIEDATRQASNLASLAAAFGNEPAVRAHVDRLASA